MKRCMHGTGSAICFECFKAGMARTRARQAAWTQRDLPFHQAPQPRKLSDQELAHRRAMLSHLVQAARKGA